MVCLTPAAVILSVFPKLTNYHRNVTPPDAMHILNDTPECGFELVRPKIFKKIRNKAEGCLWAAVTDATGCEINYENVKRELNCNVAHNDVAAVNRQLMQVTLCIIDTRHQYYTNHWDPKLQSYSFCLDGVNKECLPNLLMTLRTHGGAIVNDVPTPVDATWQPMCLEVYVYACKYKGSPDNVFAGTFCVNGFDLSRPKIPRVLLQRTEKPAQVGNSLLFHALVVSQERSLNERRHIDILREALDGVATVHHEPVTFRLADGRSYTPDIRLQPIHDICPVVWIESKASVDSRTDDNIEKCHILATHYSPKERFVCLYGSGRSSEMVAEECMRDGTTSVKEEAIESIRHMIMEPHNKMMALVGTCYNKRIRVM